MQLVTILHLCPLIIHLLITAVQGQRHGKPGLFSRFLFCLFQSSPTAPVGHRVWSHWELRSRLPRSNCNQSTAHFCWHWEAALFCTQLPVAHFRTNGSVKYRHKLTSLHGRSTARFHSSKSKYPGVSEHQWMHEWKHYWQNFLRVKTHTQDIWNSKALVSVR